MADAPAGFAGLLRHLRDSAGLTQEDLADRAQVGVNTISELERGRHLRCQIQTARRLATALGEASLGIRERCEVRAIRIIPVLAA